MSLSVFGEKALVPDDGMLGAELGECKLFWDDIINHMEGTYEGVGGEWKYYSKAAGWSFVVKSGKRTLIYLIPLGGWFKANFVFGDRAVVAAQTAGLPEPLVTLILDAKQHMEGRSFMIDIKSEEDVEIAKKLIAIKNNN